ncbi:MAG: caspase family protein, partial [Spirochaetaceae bacterium]|nr:caspase family protein [Spirochaetaceae bacterium]
LVSSLAISPDDGTCALGYANGDLVLIDTTSGREITRTGGDNQAIFKVAFSPDSRYCVAAYDAGSIRVLNTENLEAVNILSLDEQWLVYTDDGYFDCSANGFQMVGITRGLDSLSLDQEAVYRNRPDLILERMGAGGEPLQQFFRRKYLYRLALMEPFSTPLPRRLSDDILMQLTDDERATLPSTQEWRNGEADWSSLSVLQQHSLLQNRQVHDALVAYLTNDVRLPGIHVEDIIRLDDGVTATLRMEGGSFPIDRCQVEVNNVAILGELGREIVEPVVSITVPLSSGDNRVEFSCVDTAGLESAKVVRNFHSDETRTGDLIFIGFGVSDYEDDSLDLKYAAKDVADMRDTFDLMSHEYYSTVRSYGFYDSQVNAATMEQAREILSQTRVEDTVVMMVAGHGIQLVEGTPEYFFVPAAANLNDIRATGFPFTDFEQLLDGIPARTRVMLIDTCESGVADEETLHLVSSRVPTGAQARGLRVIQAESTAMPFRYTGTRNRYIFRNILQVNGSIVMSSSRANQFSYESDLIQNGFFTQGILLALGRIGEEVDLDSLTPEQRAAWDRVFADIAGYSKNELITQVSNWVQGQTGELQSPGIDRDNP